jgi:hypothetical protein
VCPFPLPQTPPPNPIRRGDPLGRPYSRWAGAARHVGCAPRTIKREGQLALPFVISLLVGRAAAPTSRLEPDFAKKRADTQVRPYRSLVIGFLLKADR